MVSHPGMRGTFDDDRLHSCVGLRVYAGLGIDGDDIGANDVEDVVLTSDEEDEQGSVSLQNSPLLVAPPPASTAIRRLSPHPSPFNPPFTSARAVLRRPSPHPPPFNPPFTFTPHPSISATRRPSPTPNVAPPVVPATPAALSTSLLNEPSLREASYLPSRIFDPAWESRRFGRTTYGPISILVDEVCDAAQPEQEGEDDDDTDDEVENVFRVEAPTMDGLVDGLIDALRAAGVSGDYTSVLYRRRRFNL